MNRVTKYLSYVFNGILIISLCVMSHYYNVLNGLYSDLMFETQRQQELHEKELTTWQFKYLNESNTNDLLHNNIRVLENHLEFAQSCKLPTYDYTSAEIEILAQCVQAEAGVNNYESQKMITQVILNRLQCSAFPNDIVEVIYQKCEGVPQFSVAYDGMLDSQEVSLETLLNVYEVLLYGYDMPRDVLYFYSTNLEEDNWVKHLITYKTVQGTTFCRGDKEVLKDATE